MSRWIVIITLHALFDMKTIYDSRWAPTLAVLSTCLWFYMLSLMLAWCLMSSSISLKYAIEYRVSNVHIKPFTWRKINQHPMGIMMVVKRLRPFFALNLTLRPPPTHSDSGYLPVLEKHKILVTSFGKLMDKHLRNCEESPGQRISSM